MGTAPGILGKRCRDHCPTATSAAGSLQTPSSTLPHRGPSNCQHAFLSGSIPAPQADWSWGPSPRNGHVSGTCAAARLSFVISPWFESNRARGTGILGYAWDAGGIRSILLHILSGSGKCRQGRRLMPDTPAPVKMAHPWGSSPLAAMSASTRPRQSGERPAADPCRQAARPRRPGIRPMTLSTGRAFRPMTRGFASPNKAATPSETIRA